MTPPILEFEKPIAEIEKTLEELKSHSEEHGMEFDKEVEKLEKRLATKRKEIYTHLTPWQRVQIARHPKRPFTLDYLERIADDFTELCGDRTFGDDHAIVGGFATIGGIKCMAIGHQKGRDTKENMKRNFGCAHPEGYRKALRLMRLADKFGLPVVTLIDTAGAYPGVASEERHVAEAIAVNLREMFTLRVPVLAIVLGEGGSGGAIGIGVANRVLILENAYYAVISPEGCAAILWKDRAAAPKAAEAMKMTAPDLKELGLVDEVIGEPIGGAHNDWDSTAEALKKTLLKHLRALRKLESEELQQQRYEKFRAYGAFAEEAVA
ncbi:MAG: acetyl-CoA carboxylase carboxyltransferase subunit alpha [Verrucomicrobiota bacterium]